MKSMTLFSESDRKGWFNLTLFQRNLTVGCAVMVPYGAIQFFLVVMGMVSRVGDAARRGVNVSQRLAQVLLSVAGWAPFLGMVFGLLAAMGLFSYLMNSRAVGMFHALPLRREGLFLTNWVSGLCFFFIPNAVVTVIALGVEGFFGAVWWDLTLRWFALHTVTAMFFFCFAMCCAMFTGHILALPVFYGVLNGLVAGLCALVDNAMDVLLVGYAGSDLFSSDLTRWCTPVWHLFQKIQQFHGVGDGYYTAAGTAIALGYCLVAGAAFTLIAVVVYQHRQLERAGDVVTVGWVRPIFQWGVGICAGLAFGTVIYINFFRRQGAWAFVAAVALCAVAGAFVARMFLKKTLRVFREGWKSCVAVGLSLLLLLGGARADFFGYQRWTPGPAEVVRVYLGNMQSLPYDSGHSGVDITDPALVEEAIALHRELVKNLDLLERTQRGGWEYITAPNGLWVTSDTTGLRIEYQRKDGSFEARWYTGVPITEEALADPDSYAARLEALINRPQVLWGSYLGWTLDREITVVSGWLCNVNAENRADRGSVEDLTEEQARALWGAFLEDLAAGRIHRYLLDGKARAENCYYTDVQFTLNLTYYLPDGNRESYASSMTVTLQKSATAMMEVLEREGLKDLLLARETGEVSYGLEKPVEWPATAETVVVVTK